ncbi:MAG TPA: hypothetical protein VFV95_12350 [Vicinamibacterales bacterium]|nr:hypothetical protein [Vicinamibacterales bacterium]
MTSQFSDQRRASRVGLLIVVLCLAAAPEIGAIDYQQALAKAVAKCQAIDPGEYQGGLLFNPDGYRSFYRRSQCFQEAAVQFREQTLCDQVKERWSLFSSSWGYSAKRCRQLVADGVSKDRAELETLKRAYSAGGMKLRDFRIERNGNGRDTDIIPTFSGSDGNSYTLRFEIVPPDAPDSPALIHAKSYYVDATNNLHLFVRQTDIKQRFPAFVLNRPYTVRATAVLDIGTGSQSGYWSDAFIERTFPIRERTQWLVKQASF